MVCRLIDFALVVLKLLMFKVCGIIDISKIFSIFPVLKGLNIIFIVIVIVIVNVIFNLSLIKYVVYSMLDQWKYVVYNILGKRLTDFFQVGTIINVYKRISSDDGTIF